MAHSEELYSFLWIGSAVLVTLALILLSLPLFYQLKLQKRKKQEALSLLINSLEVEKSTRKQIAADIHDGFASELSAVKNILAFIQKQEESKNKDILQEVQQSVQQLILNARELSHVMMPPLLESHGLGYALTDLVKKLQVSTDKGIHIQYDIDPNTTVDAHTSYEVYRMVQEFIQNHLKYNQQGHCHFTFNNQQAHYHLKYTDDSVPFLFFEIIKTANGTGLKNILSRVRILEGQLIQHPTETGNHISIHFTSQL
ncbi:MAG: hypothetical protein CFE24_08960 [Flavobacterium sp. BFFFF2]|nr:MAG: hypothetical protein CFE24_08960 [Flavobacterium sp. BFFFF2]